MAVVGMIISALAAAYSAYSASQTQKAQAKQMKYNAEADKDAANKAAEQERLNRDAARRAEAKQLKHRRDAIIAAYAKSGVAMEGTPEAVLSEQAAADEEYIQNQERISIAKQKGIEYGAVRSMQEANMTAHALRSSAQNTLITGTASAIASAASSYATYKANNLQTSNVESNSWINKG